MTKKLNTGIFYGLVSALGFSAYVLINRWIYTEYQVQGLKLTITFLTSASIFGIISLLFNKAARDEPIFSKKVYPLVINGLVTGVAIGLVVLGQNYTTAVNTSFLTTGTIITTAIFSTWLLHRYYSKTQKLWLVVLFLGIYVSIVGFHKLGIEKGDILILVAVALLGFTNVFSRVIMKNFSSRTVADVRMITGSIVFLFVGLFVFGINMFVTSASLWPIASGFFYWLGIVAFIKSIKMIGPNMAILITTTHPIWISIGAVFLLSEPFGVGEFIGAALILSSIYWISRVNENNA